MILGGGRRHFFPKDMTDVQYGNRTGRRSDKRNLVEDWVADKFKRNFAYSYVYKNEDFNEIDTEETDYLLGILFQWFSLIFPFIPVFYFSFLF